MSFVQQSQSFGQCGVVYIVVIMVTAGACCHIVVMNVDVIATAHRSVSVHAYVQFSVFPINLTVDTSELFNGQVAIKS